jgi:hypothetical protein
MVGAAEGFGGKLIRTVSFLGWTLPVSFLGGTAPLGTLGMFSAIKLILLKAKGAHRECQTLIPTSPWAIAHDLANTDAGPGLRSVGEQGDGRTPALNPRLAGAGPVAAVTRCALFPRSGDVHRQRSAFKLFVVKLFHGLAGFFRRGEFNEREAAGLARHFVLHQVYRRHDARLGEILLEIILHGLVGQVAHEESVFIHKVMSAQENYVGRTATAGSLNVVFLVRFADNLSADTDTLVL